MHKFIVNNRSRSDPRLIDMTNNRTTNTGCTNSKGSNSNNSVHSGTDSNNKRNMLNTVLKLKLALPVAPNDLLQYGPRDAAHNSKNRSQANSSGNSSSSNASSATSSTISTTPSISCNSQGCKSAIIDKPQTETSSSVSKSNTTHNTIRMSGYLKKKRNVSGSFTRQYLNNKINGGDWMIRPRPLPSSSSSVQMRSNIYRCIYLFTVWSFSGWVADGERCGSCCRIS